MEATSKGAYSFSWMTDIEDALVELWSERTHLYAISSLEYADRAAKAAAVPEISGVLDVTGNE